MPLYEYQCGACGHRFERIQKFSDELVSTCPECGGPVQKLVSSPAIQFKGTGWYITDYARSGSKGAAAGTSDSGAAGKTSGKKTDGATSAKSDGGSSKKSESGGSKSSSGSTTSTSSSSS